MLNDSFPPAPMTAMGRNDSPASGSFREANLQRRLSGGEFEELSVATRPVAARQDCRAKGSKVAVADCRCDGVTGKCQSGAVA